MEGNLLKWTNFLSGWKERYFVLKGPLLYYYYNKNDKPKGKIHLGISTVVAEDNDLYFEINTGSNIFYMQAHTQEERDKWIQAIKFGKLEGEKQIKNITNLNFDIINSGFSKLQINNETFQSLISKTEKNTQLYKDLLNKYIDDINDIKRGIGIAPSSSIENIQIKSKTGNPNRNNIYIDDNTIRNSISKGNEVFYGVDEAYDDDYNSDINIKTPFIKSSDTNNNDNIISTSIVPKQISNQTSYGNEFYDPLYDYQRRSALPIKRKELKINVWQFFKGAVGKDVNRFAVPVFFNDPLSMLQKLCENFQYAYVFNKAAVDPSPYMRLAYCACFCIGGFVMNIHRTTKFFNPILMETYEYIDNQQNFRYFAEQVSHHPAISACYAEGKGWNFYTNNNAILNFLITGKLEITNVGRCYVNFSNFNENIVFTKPLCVVRNLIFGTIILDMVGKFTVTNDKGDICEIEMIPSTSGEQGNVTGTIKDIYGNIHLKFGGNWLDKLYVTDIKSNEKKVLWEMIPSSDQYSYYFQPYSFDLNNLTEEMKRALPPTDSRFRPDQRMMEMQEIDEAGEEKHRLEEKQRKARKENEKEGITPKPMYFDETYDDLSGELIYKYKGNYFDDRKKRNFSHFPDIF